MAFTHDQIISEIVLRLNRDKYDIYTNPGQEHNAGIGANYPDVILTDKGTNTVRFFMEVETADSVNAEECQSQWRKYYSEINATFYLVVPVSSLNRAKEICQKCGINARFTTYAENDGLIEFNFQ